MSSIAKPFDSSTTHSIITSVSGCSTFTTQIDLLYVISIGVAAFGEYGGNPQINNLLGAPQPNLEGKEVRFGWAETALWAVTTTGTMCGAVNGMHDSLMPPAGFATLFNLFLQIVWGGQGPGTAD